MSHWAQLEFIGTTVRSFQSLFAGKVLEIGSLDITGSVASLFTAEEYIGVDVGPGKNVTMVGRGEELSFDSNYFDVVISSECFEHNPAWKTTFANMLRMTKPGGLLVMTCAGIGRLEHGTSRSDYGVSAPLMVESGSEYYRNLSKRDLRRVIDPILFSQYSLYSNWGECDLYFVGLKSSDTLENLEQFQVMLVECNVLLRKLNRISRVLKIQFEMFRWLWKVRLWLFLHKIFGENFTRRLRGSLRRIGI
jgi:SAM-dependent methyltransferase